MFSARPSEISTPAVAAAVRLRDARRPAVGKGAPGVSFGIPK
jgi:hypothetical protein